MACFFFNATETAKIGIMANCQFSCHGADKITEKEAEYSCGTVYVFQKVLRKAANDMTNNN